jgi:hypothetical protein
MNPGPNRLLTLLTTLFNMLAAVSAIAQQPGSWQSSVTNRYGDTPAPVAEAAPAAAPVAPIGQAQAAAPAAAAPQQNLTPITGAPPTRARVT